MPDRADVEQSLAELAASAFYPNGIEAGTVLEADCRVYRGWPTPKILEEEVSRGLVHVTVQSQPGSVRTRTRYPADWIGARPAPSLLGSVEGDIVTLSGTGGPGHLVGVAVDGKAYVYRMQTGDTPTLVAAVLAEQIRADRPAIAIGSELKVTAARGLQVRVVTDAIGGRELRRQSALFKLSLWCPDPATRDSVAEAIDLAIAEQTFLAVGGWACRIVAAGDSSSDTEAGSGVWRRDLLYSIEYPTVSSEILPTMIFGTVDINGVPFIG